MNINCDHLSRRSIANCLTHSNSPAEDGRLGICVMRTPLIALVTLLLSACQPSLHNLRAELDSGNAGYAGEVKPFSVPYLLRYEPTPALNLVLKGIVKAPDGTESAISARGTLKISAIGVDRIMEMSMSEIDFGDKARARSSGSPLVTARMLISSRGIAQEIDVDFPAYVGRSDVPSRDSDTYKTMVKTMKDVSIALPQNAVRLGDTMWSSDEIAEILIRDVNWPVHIQKSPQSNTLASKIIGETIVDGRPHLVVEHSGGIAWSNAANGLAISTRGYSLVDTRFGITRRFRLAVSVFGRTGEKVGTVEALFQRDISN